MRIAPDSRKKQRRAVDRRLVGLGALASIPPPRNGWIRAIRESLGLTAAQLARRLGVSTIAVTALEKRELAGTASVETLRRAAEAMRCRLVYAVVPIEGTLEEMVDAQSVRAAKRLSKRAAHSMGLEQQGVDDDETQAQVRDLARTLKDTMQSSMWDEPDGV